MKMGVPEPMEIGGPNWRPSLLLLKKSRLSNAELVSQARRSPRSLKDVGVGTMTESDVKLEHPVPNFSLKASSGRETQNSSLNPSRDSNSSA